MTHSYGGKPNDALLQFYGFVDTDNPHDTYTADMADWVKTRYGVLEERWQFVETDAAVMQSLQQVCSICLSHLYITLDIILVVSYLKTQVILISVHICSTCSTPYLTFLSTHWLVVQMTMLCCIHVYMHAQDLF